MKNVAIETCIAERSDQLHRVLVSSTERHWLLLDPVLRPMFDETPLGLILAQRTAIPVPSTGDPDSSLMPLLVEFFPTKASDHDLLWQSLSEALEELAPEKLAQGGGRRICGWLESGADEKSLARHIATQMIQPHSEAHRRLLRWHDPSVLWAMWPLLTQGQQATLLGPITSFLLFDPVGHWVKFKTPQVPDSQALGLSMDQWLRIECIAALNGLIREFDLIALSAEQINAKRDSAMVALIRARQLGFCDRQDQRAFARMALTVHPSFDMHPLVAERLAKRDSDDYFTALVDDLSLDDWARIRRDNAKLTAQ